MMQHELQERLVNQLEPWQWTMAEYVYMNHPTIKDVGGKDQIAELIKEDGEGWRWNSPIQTMYKETNGPDIIKYTQEDLYSTWEVTQEGRCINDKPKAATAVGQAVKAIYEKEYPELASHVEYFSTESTEIKYDGVPDVWPQGRIAVFYVAGDSEGYYVHVEVLAEKHQCMMLIKTLRESEGGISWAEQTANAISRIMRV